MSKKLTFNFDSEFIKWIANNESYYYKDSEIETICNLSDYSFSDDDIKYLVDIFKKGERFSKDSSGIKFLHYRLKYIKKRYYRMFGNEQKIIDDATKQNDFIKWWKTQKRATDKTLLCYYCNASETDYHNALFVNKTILLSKKENWNCSNMEIDEKIPNNIENEEKCRNYDFSKNGNCVFCCHFCNNAKTIKFNKSYISESKVYDYDLKRNVYVVSRIGELLYATFDSSLLDYEKGISNVIPEKIEGDDYLWFGSEKDTKYYDIYSKNLNRITGLEHKEYINRKYSHLKKPTGLNYEIIDKTSEDQFGCSGTLDATKYNMTFYLPDECLYLYGVAYSGIFGSFYQLFSSEEAEDPQEKYSYFTGCKKSKYYDLFLELEKYIDNYYGNSNEKD